MAINTINGDSGSATGAVITLTGGSSGAFFTASGSTVTQSFNYLALPTTTSTNGQVLINSVPVLHAYGTNNFFAGPSAGNFTLTGTSNVAVGYQSMKSATTGSQNVFVGYQTASSGAVSGTGNNVGIGFSAMQAITSGTNNTALGSAALQNGTTMTNNTAIGTGACANVSGTDNTAMGYLSLSGASNTGTFNTCYGSSTITAASFSGSYNVAIGASAGSSVTGSNSHNIYLNNTGTNGDNNVCRIGAATGTGQQQLNKTFIHGIRGITTTNADAIAVLVDSAGQLGTVSSSIRYKENIVDMGDVSSPVMSLRPVTFDFIGKPSHKKQVGLIAEEVEQIMPSLVAYNEDGEVESVKYHDLPVLLLNELQKLYKRVDALEAKVK